MKCIKDNQENIIIEKKSKFITRIFYAADEIGIKLILDNIKKKEKGAGHNCYAYRVLYNNQIIERKNDDGEPGGTAGAPMLAVITGEDLINILVITTRYFGGVKLGTGGLVNVYKNGVKEVLKKCELMDFEIIELYKLVFSLNQADFVNGFLKKNNIKIKEKKFQENVEYILELSEKNFIKIKEILMSIKGQLIKIKEVL